MKCANETVTLELKNGAFTSLSLWVFSICEGCGWDI